MGKINDITNHRFGRLIALYPVGKTKSRHIIWKCKCDCGTVVNISGTSLRSGKTRSCGCLQKESVSQKNRKDLTGQKFGRLTAEEITDKRINQKIIWKCKCDCGNITYVKSGNLLNGDTKSCGCLKSIGEYNITQILLENNINFIKEFRASGLPLFSFDFAIFDEFNTLIRIIEFDGEQHYNESRGLWKHTSSLSDTQKRDSLKTSYCLNNNIPLVRIPYWHRNNINLNMLLGDDYLCTK